MLGEILKQRREQLGLSVQDMARMTGMPPKQVVALETGHMQYFAGGKLEIERLTKLYAKKNKYDCRFLIFCPASGRKNVC